MFGIFSRKPRQETKSKPRSVRLFLEPLETRDCPASITVDALVLSGHRVTLSGAVSACQLAGATVTFSGAASATTITDAAGHYSFTTDTASLGAVYAVGVDLQQVATNTASAVIAVTAPTLTLSLSYGSQRTITLSGQVTNIDPSLTITFTGVASGSVVSSSSGAFSFTTDASALGTVQASTTDLWGQASNSPQVTVASNAPVIVNFVAIQVVGNFWTFQGQVNDESPQGLVVSFGNMASLAGQSVSVQANGSFSLTIELQPGETGTASAQTTDWWGLNSDLVYAVVA